MYGHGQENQEDSDIDHYVKEDKEVIDADDSKVKAKKEPEDLNSVTKTYVDTR